MSLTKQYELKGLHSLKSNTCGDGPWRPGRPKKECSNVLKDLRALCKKMEGYTYQKRVCRLKMKPGRKPKAKPKNGGFRTAAMGAAAAMRKRVTPRAPPPSPASLRKTPKAPVSARRSPARVTGCHTIRYTAEEKRALKAPRTSPGTRQRLKNKCAGFKNVKGRTCRVDVPKGLCKAA